MGKLQEFCLKLDNNKTVYSSGEVVSGFLVVSLSAPMKVRGIRVTCQGRAGVNWRETKTESSEDNKKTVLVHFNAEELYLNHREVLWGEDSDNDFIGVLPAGYYEFPFSVDLPKNLPCSFEGDHGCVSYKIRATIDKPWARDHNVKLYFTVIGTYDLNNDPLASEAIDHTAEQTVCCGCCTAGHFSLRYYIDRRGFVPGEEIPLVVEVKNLSRRRLVAEVKFKMVTTYFANDDSKKQEEELDRFDMDPVSANSTGAWRTSIDIPPTPPSHLMGCDIIDVDYIIRLKVAPDGCNCDSIEFHDDILVGTIPLQHVVEQMMANEELSDELSDVDATPAASGATPSAPLMGFADVVIAKTGITMPMPMYAKCVHSKGNVLDDDDTATSEAFTPQYAFYNWKQMAGRMKPKAIPKIPPQEQVMSRHTAEAQDPDAGRSGNSWKKMAGRMKPKSILKSPSREPPQEQVMNRNTAEAPDPDAGRNEDGDAEMAVPGLSRL